MDESTKVAIVTTIRGAGRSVYDWIDYHLAIDHWEEWEQVGPMLMAQYDARVRVYPGYLVEKRRRTSEGKGRVHETEVLLLIPPTALPSTHPQSTAVAAPARVTSSSIPHESHAENTPTPHEFQHRNLTESDGSFSQGGVHYMEARAQFLRQMFPLLKLPHEVQARQQLHAYWGYCEYLRVMCYQETENNDDIGWLLHLDVDELLYCENLAQHLARLTLDNIGTLTYCNLEGTPEQFDTDTPFDTVTLFKLPLSFITLSAPAQQAIDYWQRHSVHGQYFRAYDVGKSIVRVCNKIRAIPQGVHKWRVYSFQKDENYNLLSKNEIAQNSDPTPIHYESRTAIIDPRYLDLSSLYSCNECVILHYVVAGYSWWYRKYHILQDFPNSWFNGKIAIDPSFHRDSRDVFMKGNENEMKEFYRSHMVLTDNDEKKAQQQAGVCQIIKYPCKVLSNVDRKGKEMVVREYMKVGYYRDIESKSRRNDSATIIGTDTTIADSPKNTTETPPNNLSLFQMWSIASLVSSYLQPDTTITTETNITTTNANPMDSSHTVINSPTTINPPLS